MKIKGIDVFVYKVVVMLNVIDEGCSVNDYIDFWKIYLGIEVGDDDKNL